MNVNTLSNEFSENPIKEVSCQTSLQTQAPPPDMPPAMILCGGMGTRLRDVSEILPKPMVPIGTQPIVWHIMKCFAAFGVKRFILCLGYKKEEFVDYFINFQARATDVTIKLGDKGYIKYHNPYKEEDWEVTLAHTGLETMTGGRIVRASKYLKPEDNEFFLTYGDGVSDVNIEDLLAFHRKKGQMLTLTAVHPEGRFGEMNLCGSKIEEFSEKRARMDGYINGGFMVINREFIPRYLSDQNDDYLERGPFERAAGEGQMSAFLHEGFWQCMDTAREYKLLNDLWENRPAPWVKYW